MRKEQYLLVFLGMVLVGGLYFGGKTISGKKKDKEVAAGPQTTSMADYEQLQLSVLPAEDADRIRQLNAALTLDPGYANYLALSKAWENSGNYPLGAYNYYMAAVAGPDSISFEAAGDKLYNGYKNFGDSLITNNLINFALASYERALDSDSDNVELRMKLAEVYVDGPEPMKGIMLLREMTESLPEYSPAQMALGRLSLQTGQYDKAAERFQKVLSYEPMNTEALYFLALSKEGLGQTEDAIQLLELCVELVNNPEFTREINAYISDLKKQN